MICLRMMICLILLFSTVLNSHVFAPRNYEDIEDYYSSSLDQCIIKEKASSDDIEQIKKLEIPEDYEGKCVVHCLLKIFHLQEENGKINMEGALLSLEEIDEYSEYAEDSDFLDNLISAVVICATEAENADPCIAGTNFVSCVMENVKENNLFEDLVLFLQQ